MAKKKIIYSPDPFEVTDRFDYSRIKEDLLITVVYAIQVLLVLQWQ
jgi:hypothetical protein